jgi:type I restriction enzyme R subunit
MSKVGQKEKETQSRVVKLFKDKDQLNYAYLGNWQDR